MKLQHLLHAALGGLLLLGGAADAHHGFSGRYDAGQPVWLEGRVDGVRFGAPHSVLHLVVSPTPPPTPMPAELGFLSRPATLPAALVGQRVTLEFPPVERFNGLRGRVEPGDVVALVAYRNCLAPHQWRVQWMRLADGSTAVRGGPLQTEVPSCG